LLILFHVSPLHYNHYNNYPIGVLYAHWKYEWITKWTNNNQTDDMFSFFMDLSFPGYPETVRFLFDVDDTNEVSTGRDLFPL
jgi:hypothetical protein